MNSQGSTAPSNDPREHSGGGVPGTTGTQDRPPRWTNQTSPGSEFAITTGLAGDLNAHGKQAVVLFSCRKTEDDQITFTAYTCVEKGSQSFPGISTDLHVATIMELANANKTQLEKAGRHSALRFDSLAPTYLSESPDKPKDASREMATLFEDLWTRPTPSEPFRQRPYTCLFRGVPTQDIEKYRQHLDQGGETTGNQPATYGTSRTKQFLNVLNPDFIPKPITLSTMFDGASVQLSTSTPRTKEHEYKVLKTRARNQKTQRQLRKLAAAKNAKSVSPPLESESSICRPQANRSSASQISSARTDTLSVPLGWAARNLATRRPQEFIRKSATPNRPRHSENSSSQNMIILDSLLPGIDIRTRDPNSNLLQSIHGADVTLGAHYLHPDSACQPLDNRFHSPRYHVHNTVPDELSPELDNPPDSQSHHHISTMAQEMGPMYQIRAPVEEWSGDSMNQHEGVNPDISLVPVHGTAQYGDLSQYGDLYQYGDPRTNQYGHPAQASRNSTHDHDQTSAVYGSQNGLQSDSDADLWRRNVPNPVSYTSAHDSAGRDPQGYHPLDCVDPSALILENHQGANLGFKDPNSWPWRGGR
jgi:hypothetical protein